VRAARDTPEAEELTDMRRVLRGLHAIRCLHLAQEEELSLMLGDEAGGVTSAAQVTA
jgi:hypothetical protein